MLSDIRGSITLLGIAIACIAVAPCANAASGLRNAASRAASASMAGVAGSPGIALQVTVALRCGDRGCATGRRLAWHD